MGSVLCTLPHHLAPSVGSILCTLSHHPAPGGLVWVLYCVHCLTTQPQVDWVDPVLCTLPHHPAQGELVWVLCCVHCLTTLPKVDWYRFCTVYTASPPCPRWIGVGSVLCTLSHHPEALTQVDWVSNPDPGGLGSLTVYTASPSSSPDPDRLGSRTVYTASPSSSSNPGGLVWALSSVHCPPPMPQVNWVDPVLCTMPHYPHMGVLDGSHTVYTASPSSNPDPGGLCGSHTVYTVSPSSSPDPGELNRRTLLAVESPITPNQPEPISFKEARVIWNEVIRCEKYFFQTLSGQYLID